MADLALYVYCVSLATLIFHGWRKRNSAFVQHASSIEWVLIIVIALCPIVNTIAAIKVWLGWYKE